MIPRHFQITVGLVLLAILVSGVVIIRITHKEEAMTLQDAETAPVAPAVSGKQEQIQVLVAYDDDQALRWRTADVFLPADRGLRARETLRSGRNRHRHGERAGTGDRTIFLACSCRIHCSDRGCRQRRHITAEDACGA